jgi:hypothetical protein
MSGAKGAHILSFQEGFIFVPLALVSLQIKNKELPQIISCICVFNVFHLATIYETVYALHHTQ